MNPIGEHQSAAVTDRAVAVPVGDVTLAGTLEVPADARGVVVSAHGSGNGRNSPAAYIRALDLSVIRLDQTYRRLDDRRYDYTSEADFRAVLEYDAAGLIVDYPGIAVRFA